MALSWPATVGRWRGMAAPSSCKGGTPRPRPSAQIPFATRHIGSRHLAGCSSRLAQGPPRLPTLVWYQLQSKHPVPPGICDPGALLRTRAVGVAPCGVCVSRSFVKSDADRTPLSPHRPSFPQRRFLLASASFFVASAAAFRRFFSPLPIRAGPLPGGSAAPSGIIVSFRATRACLTAAFGLLACLPACLPAPRLFRCQALKGTQTYVGERVR